MILSFDTFNEELNNTLPKEGINNLIDRIKKLVIYPRQIETDLLICLVTKTSLKR